MNTNVRVRPSWRPWISRYSEPLIQANQIMREDDRELDGARGRHVLREVVGRLADDGDVDEVVEQLEVADDAVADGSRRAAAAAARTSA